MLSDANMNVIDESTQRLSVDASGRQALTIVDPQTFLEHQHQKASLLAQKEYLTAKNKAAKKLVLNPGQIR